MPVSFDTVKNYLEKQALYPTLINEIPHPNLRLSIVIPCFDEKNPGLILDSLLQCELPKSAVEVLLIVNQAENISNEINRTNREAYDMACTFAQENNRDTLRFFPVFMADLPDRHAGVGLARKIGMDEAVRRMNAVDQSAKGIIVCLDADCTVEKNYLRAIEAYFENSSMIAANIRFEHLIDLENLNSPNMVAIVEYELHLRYYRHIQQYAGFPFYQYTIGSAMAVRCEDYCRQGGMNKRKAGEDFYFLQKFISLGQVGNINDTIVYPSSRISHRVPFGTGKAVGDRIRENQPLTTYAPETFTTIRTFFSALQYLHEPPTDDETFLLTLPLNVRSFLQNNDFLKKINEIRANTSNRITFANRFYQWFNAFLIVKYAHYSRDNYFPNIPVTEAGNWLVKNYYNHKPIGNALDLLKFYRILDVAS